MKPGPDERPSSSQSASSARDPDRTELFDAGAAAPPGVEPRGPGDAGALASGGLPFGGYIHSYQLIRELGRGGMGQVFLARDTRLGRLVAIKLLATQSERFTERLIAEARATARCSHENIVIVHEVDVHHGRPYMVLEYLQGVTLRRWMMRGEPALPAEAGPDASPQSSDSSVNAHGDTHEASPDDPVPGPSSPRSPVPAARAIELMIPVVKALVCAHEHGIVHRDLKPENIMMTRSGTIKVLDFGIAKVSVNATRGVLAGVPESSGSGSLTATGMVMGTMPYMSPEQWRGAEIDHRSDLWAIGIMLHDLAIGQHPLAPLSEARLRDVPDLDVPMPSARRQRPDLGALAELIDRCLVKPRDLRVATAQDLLAELLALVPSPARLRLGENDNPFAGLAAFQERDEGRFFGRERDIASLAAEVRRRPLVTLVGSSGAGKSSLVRAGLLPALKRSGEGWQASILRPGRRPLATLASLLVEFELAISDGSDDARGPVPEEGRDSEPPGRSSLIRRLRDEPGYFGARLRFRIGPERRLVLFADQFEELYTLNDDPDERSAFVACLTAAADDAASPIRVVLSMRADFLERITEDHHFMTEVAQGIMFLPPMSRDGLRDALTRPLDAAGYRFESDDIVEEMLDSLETTRGALPLLSFTAARLWDTRDRQRRLVTRDSYVESGGLEGALAAHADTVLAAMSRSEQRIARAIVERLVTPERTRAIVTMSELRESAGAADDIDRVALHLANARLIAIEVDGDREDPGIELIHESLIERWPRLQRWLEANQEEREFRARLRAAAREWHRQGRAEDALWRGQAAGDATRWLQRSEAAADDRDSRGPGPVALEATTRGPGIELGGHELDYLRAVVALAQRARRRRRRVIMAALATLAAITFAVSWLALRADRARVNADQQRERASAFAAQASQRLIELYVEQGRRALLEGEPMHAFAYLLEARREGADSPAMRFLLARATERLDGQLAVLQGHRGEVWVARFSHDGSRVLTASSDGTARVWSADGGELLAILDGHEDRIWDARFSPDDTSVATVGWDGAIKSWDPATGGLRWSRTHRGRPRWVDFRRDGSEVISVSSDKTVRFWAADTGDLVRTILVPRGDRLTTAALSPDGEYLIVGSHDGIAQSLHIATGDVVFTVDDHRDNLPVVAVSPDNQLVATASWGQIARVFPITGGDVLTLGGHAGRVNHVAFSPDATRVVTTSEDRTARIWDARNGALLHSLEGHTGGLTFAGYSPDGVRIVTASRDGTLRTWDSRTGLALWTFAGHGDGVWRAHFKRTGTTFVTAGLDHTARIWNAGQNGHVLALPLQDRDTLDARASPDGRRIATIQADGTVRVWDRRGDIERSMGVRVKLAGRWEHGLSWHPDSARLIAAVGQRATVWDVASGRSVLQFGDHGERTLHAAYDSRGARVVTAGLDGTAKVWDARTGALLVTMEGHGSAVRHAEFHPDGTRVITAGDDRMVRVWSAVTGDELLVLEGHTLGVNSARFSADGTLIVSAAEDKTARVWTASGQSVVALDGHGDALSDAAVSPDSELVATASEGGSIKVWEPESRRVLWSIELGVTRGRSVQFLADGDELLGSFGRTARIWRLSYDDRSVSELEAFAACQVGYALVEGQLERVDLDAAACVRGLQ